VRNEEKEIGQYPSNRFFSLHPDPGMNPNRLYLLKLKTFLLFFTYYKPRLLTSFL
jgi:hypothetical protein